MTDLEKKETELEAEKADNELSSVAGGGVMMPLGWPCPACGKMKLVRIDRDVLCTATGCKYKTSV